LRASLAAARVTDDWRQTLARGVTDHPLATLAAAGGRFTDHEGRDAFDSGRALVSNGRLHDEALRALAEPAG
jgi:acetylornithine/succinyldiaminopimelate/putrescine aminotransferase